ncbi:hypothetical protein C2S51_020993 [Perilla frutescens var. frutescens]|nr:hypothetical protein C2S51_020993 [Perilla frutescens var. frutescens]
MASAWINNFHPQSRFSDAAELTESRHLFIEGNIKTKMMSPETSYAAYLVYGFADMYANLRSAVSIIRKNSYHESSGDDYGDEQAKIVRFQEGDGREDGWMEIQLGEFYVDFGEDGELQVQLLDTSGNSKNGLIVEGIEFRPFDTTKT